MYDSINLQKMTYTPTIVGEIGCNHMGKMDIAYEMIKMAAIFSRADYVKFQKRNPKELLSEAQYDAPHPNPVNSYGETYGKHREYLEFTPNQHRQLIDWCQELNIGYSCSVWDLTSAREIISLKPDYLKIPSASNTHYEMLEFICSEFSGQIHISLGMTTEEELAQIIDLIGRYHRCGDTVLYVCASGYPVPFEDCHLLEICNLKNEFGDKFAGIGLSGHHLGIAIDNAALALGATWFERHYTLDRTYKGTDHAASLEPDGLRRLCRDLRATSRALTRKPKEILDIEQPQRKKLKWQGK
jgi:N-acetylneuraminate synthase